MTISSWSRVSQQRLPLEKYWGRRTTSHCSKWTTLFCLKLTFVTDKDYKLPCNTYSLLAHYWDNIIFPWSLELRSLWTGCWDRTLKTRNCIKTNRWLLSITAGIYFIFFMYSGLWVGVPKSFGLMLAPLQWGIGPFSHLPMYCSSPWPEVGIFRQIYKTKHKENTWT